MIVGSHQVDGDLVSHWSSVNALGSSTFCCVQCRLLQQPTTTCIECGASTTAPVELVRELLFYRETRDDRQRELGILSAFLAGSAIAAPVLAPFAVGSLIALGIHKLRVARKRMALVGIDMPLVPAAAGASTLFGIARKFQTTFGSLIDNAPALVEHAVLKDRDGAVVLRRTEAVPFLLDVEWRNSGHDGDDEADREALAAELPVLVTGVARVTSPNVLARRIRVGRADPRLARMGVPADLVVDGELEISTVTAAGPGLAVTGVLGEEAVAELAFHRDGGRIRVVRGRVGAPVLVEDRRLIAAAL
jgi:hypothetical protein